MGPEHVTLVVVGLAAGLVGGLLGIGGSILMIPAMVLLLDEPGQPPRQHLYQGAAMIVNFFVVLPSVVQHRRAGAIVPPVVRVMIPSAAASVLAGVWLSAGPWFRGDRAAYLTCVFGIFLLYAAGYNVYRLFVRRRLTDMSEEQAAALPTARVALAVGVPMGLAAGLLGIGGGALAVPLQQLFLRMPLRKAIANSAATIVLVSVIGASYKNCANALAGISFVQAISLAAWLAPTAIVGGYLGGRLTHVLPRRALRAAVVLLMCYAGLRMIDRAVDARSADRPEAGAVAVRTALTPTPHTRIA